jgi:hypothetical protein
MTAVAHVKNNQLANTDIKFDIPSSARINGGMYVLGSGQIVVHPIVTHLRGHHVTNDLLDHEQGHYDIGLLTARALAPDLANASGNTTTALANMVVTTRDLHVITRMEPIQRLYDQQTNHGTNKIAQTLWSGMIQVALAIPQPISLMGLPL